MAMQLARGSVGGSPTRGQLICGRRACQTGNTLSGCLLAPRSVIFGSWLKFLRRGSREEGHSPRLLRGDGEVRVWQHVRHPLHPGRDPHGHLQRLPPVLHGQAEAGRHGRPCRAVPPEVPEGDRLSLRDRLAEAVRRFGEVERELLDPKTVRDAKLLASLGREHQRLAEVVRLEAQLRKDEDELAQVRELVSIDDPEMAQEARAEEARLLEDIDGLLGRLKPLIVPPDPLDDRPAIVEIRAGTGGDEAALFARDLFRMYTRFVEHRGWRYEIMSMSEGAVGGLKEVIFKVTGDRAFGVLRWESGVHRVQRVPATENAGRIHTSAATVAVLPEAEEVDVKIEDKDLRIDVFRSSGPGGQSVNTTDSAVRITHIPSGLVVSQQDQKSQLQNKIKAMQVLRSRLLDAKIAEQEAERARMRKTQVGTGDRSAKVRTYNFPQSRVTDHRIGWTTHALPQVLDGALGELLDALKLASQTERAA